jgi:hypothetical protein
MRDAEAVPQIAAGAGFGIALAIINWTVKLQVAIPGTPFYFHHVWVGIASVIMAYLKPFLGFHWFLLSFGLILIVDDVVLHAANGTNLFW